MNNRKNFFLNVLSIVLVFIASTLFAQAQIYLYQKDGLLGLKNYCDSSIITPAVYDKIEFSCSLSYYEESAYNDQYKDRSIGKNIKANFWIVWKNDLCGVINAQGKEIIPISCSSVQGKFFYGYIHFQKNNKHFLADTTGKLFFESNLTFEQTEKYIYYRDGELKKSVIINYAGTRVLETDYIIRQFAPSQRFFIGIQDSNSGLELVDLSGKSLESRSYGSIRFVSPYILCYNQNSQLESSVYNNAGDLLYRHACSNFYAVDKKYLSVGCTPGNSILLDSTGKYVIPQSTLNTMTKRVFYKDYYLANVELNGVSADRLYFYNGRLVFDKPVNVIAQFENRYIIKMNEVTYLADSTGTILREFPYNVNANQSTFPYVVVSYGENMGVVNLIDGSIVSEQPKKEYVYLEIFHIQDQYYFYVFDQKRSLAGLQNVKGEFILPLQYHRIYHDKNMYYDKNIIVAIDKDQRYSYYSAQMDSLYGGISFRRDDPVVIPGFLYADRTENWGKIYYDKNFKELLRSNGSGLENGSLTNIINGYYIVATSAPSYKWGIFGINREVFVKPVYDAITVLKGPYFVVKQNNSYGIIDINGNEKVPVVCTNITVTDRLLRCMKDGMVSTYRVTSDSLYLLLDTPYELVEPIDKGLKYFIVKQDGRFGIITPKDVVVPIAYDGIDIKEKARNMILLRKDNLIYFSLQSDPSILTKPYRSFKFASDDYKITDIIVNNGSKYGVINNCNVLLDAIYDEIYYKEKDLYIVTLNKKSAIFYKDAFLTPMDIDSVFYKDQNGYFSSNMYFFRQGKYYLLFVNSNEKLSKPSLTDSKEKISAAYSKIQKYNGTYVIVEKDTMYGLLKNNNTFLLDVIYQNIQPAGPQGELIVRQQGMYGMASEKSGILIPILFDSVQSLFDNGYYLHNMQNEYYRVMKKNTYGIYDNKGKEILPLEYDFIQASGQYFMDQAQKNNPGKKSYHLESLIYRNISPKKNRFIVKQHNLYGVIDYSQKILIPIEYDLIVDNGTGYLIQKNGKCGYANSEGNVIVPPVYEKLNKVEDEDAFYIYENHQWGVLSYDLKVLIRPQFDSITFDYQKMHLYKIMKGDLIGLADLSGKILIPPGKYEFITKNIDESICFVLDQDKNYAIYSFKQKKFLTPFIYKSYKIKKANWKPYYMLYAKDSKYLSIYIPGTTDSPPKAVYDKIIYNEDKKRFELYYKAKDGTQKYHTYISKRVLSKPKHDNDDD
jgi:hypothetical protein